MKKFLSLMAIAVFAAVSFTSCSSDESTPVYVVDFEEDYFSALVDNPQYGGPLIYSADSYTWTDPETTLSSSVVKADWSAWGAGYGWDYGFAVSNYVNNAADAGYQQQLSVPESNGSKNFIVCYGDNSELTFADGKAHVIRYMSVSPTTYVLNNIKANATTSDYYFNVVFNVTKSDGTILAVPLVVAQGTQYISSWNTIDLSTLGAIKKITFTFEGSDSGDYGLNTPKYLAIDNIVIEQQ